MVPERNPPTELHRALAHARRARIAAELDAAPAGLDARQLATRLGLHPNTIRWHLAVLSDAGLVSSSPAEHAARGRPRLLYRLRPGAVAGGDDYRLLAAILTGTLATIPDGAARAERAGRDWGRYLVTPPPPGTRLDRDGATTAVAALLDRHGFAPRIADDAISMHRCPFAELASAHRGIVCGLHRGLIDGALQELGTGLETSELEILPLPDRCVARLGPASHRRRPDRTAH